MSWIAALYNKAQDQYGINPLIFIALYAFSFIPFYIGVFQILRGLRNHDAMLILKGLFVNRIAWCLPYWYVLFMGHDLPWVIKVPVIVWPVWTVLFAYRKRHDKKYVEKWQKRLDGWLNKIPKRWRQIDVTVPDNIITVTEVEYANHA